MRRRRRPPDSSRQQRRYPSGSDSGRALAYGAISVIDLKSYDQGTYLNTVGRPHSVATFQTEWHTAIAHLSTRVLGGHAVSDGCLECLGVDE